MVTTTLYIVVSSVEIEMELIVHSVSLDIYNYEPKLTNGFITILKKESTVYTEEEVYSLYKKTCERLTNSFISYDIEWFNNNKKK